MAEYSTELCIERHNSDRERLVMLEKNYQSMAEKHDATLGRIHARFDEVSKELLLRLPPWATFSITILGSAVTGLSVIIIERFINK